MGFMFMKFKNYCLWVLSIALSITYAQPMMQVRQHNTTKNPIVATPPTLHFDPLLLKNNAESVGFGYKTSNLVELNKIFSSPALKNSLGGYTVTVPEFAGLTSSQVQTFLKLNRIDIATRWEQILERYIGEPEIGEALEDKKLPAPFFADLEELANDIQQTFNRKAQELEICPEVITKPAWFAQRAVSWAYSTLASMFSQADNMLGNHEAQTLINTAKDNDWRLMARSTGKEDTEDLANAGGNTSVSNVIPTNADVLRAVGIVVASYFRTKSISQRLSAGDPTLFNMPLTPALLQRMIGEQTGGAIDATRIPVGCVAYSQEAEGDTEHVAALQCGYGHPEGVVESSVPVDTFYVDGDNNIYAVIKDKHKRLVPIDTDGKLGLLPMNNSNHARTSPVLSPNAVTAINTVVQAVHDYYGKPMDLELAYQPDTKTIYIVQARPIVGAKNLSQPSYIANLDALKSEDIIYGSSVSVAGGAVREIIDPTHIIVAQKLDDALNIYLKNKNQRSAIIAVVVQDEAESTSHAAAVFRGDGKIIIRTDNKNIVHDWAQQQSLHLAIDPQRGVIINLGDHKLPAVTQGWFNHPLPQEISVGHLMTSTDTCAKGQLHLPLHNLDTLIENLKVAKPAVAQQALETLLAELQHAAQEIVHKDPPTAPEQQALSRFEKIIEHVNTLVPTLQQGFTLPARDIRRLLPIRFVEALLFQQPSKTVVDAHSYTAEKETLSNKMQFMQQHTLSKQIMHDIQLFDIAYHGATAAISPELEQRWVSFVNNLVPTLDPAGQAEFKVMMQTIEEIGMMPTWLHFIFAPAEKGHANPQESYQALHQAFVKNQQFIESLVQQKKALDSFDLEQFAHPTKFETAFAQLNNYLTYFTSQDFEATLKNINDNQFTFVATLPVMKDFVELFDQSIKALKSSTQYPTEQKVTLFKRMLEPYLSLLEHWAPIIPDGTLKYNPSWPLKHYLKELRTSLQGLTSTEESQLLPSDGFGVQAAALGSVAHFHYHRPKTLEDIFTTIHQSLLITVSALNKQCSDAAFEKPELLQKSLVEIAAGHSLTGIHFTKGSFTYSFNIPLLNHSAALDITYNKKQYTVALGFKFYGLKSYGFNNNNRWSNIRAFAQTVALIFDLPISNITLKGLELSFAITINDIRFVAMLKHFLTQALALTYSPNYRTTIMNFLDFCTDNDHVKITDIIDGISEHPVNLTIVAILNWLVTKGHGIDQAMTTATACMQSNDANQHILALQILNALVYKGHGINQAIEATIVGMKSMRWRVQWNALELIIALVDKGSGINQVIAVAFAGLLACKAMMLINKYLC